MCPAGSRRTSSASQASTPQARYTSERKRGAAESRASRRLQERPTTDARPAEAPARARPKPRSAGRATGCPRPACSTEASCPAAASRAAVRWCEDGGGDALLEFGDLQLAAHPALLRRGLRLFLSRDSPHPWLSRLHRARLRGSNLLSKRRANAAAGTKSSSRSSPAGGCARTPGGVRPAAGRPRTISVSTVTVSKRAVQFPHGCGASAIRQRLA